ncbi:hypothetical protein JL475_30245 [Streptomyces sp. M2CJ-2]|uniref:hypothetical protein n=1 Tax=Streptomyces sp. M2CJ-2 TaxID=2803948 RepID=UPI001926C9A9|nr:hypothetical protein [Streptomyces sp. M2CJ-2]MBL3670186.1 hypothetical protein [Streptomyces sp. M2CJ-2]
MTQYDAILIDEDGTIVVINLPANREHFAEYAAAVLRCSSVEPFDLTTGVAIWTDEDGHGRWGYNALADGLVDRYGHTNSLSGPVLITGYGTHVKALTPQDASRILRELNDIAA